MDADPGLPYVAFRWFRLQQRPGQELELLSWNRPTSWPLRPGAVLRAEAVVLPDDDPFCPHGLRPGGWPGPVPAPECVCGIYGWWSLDTALRAIRRFVPEQRHRRHTLIVPGAVQMGGLCRVHGQTGCRAQEARVAALAVHSREQRIPLIEEAAARLGVPVLLAAEMRPDSKVVREWGETRPGGQA